MLREKERRYDILYMNWTLLVKLSCFINPEWVFDLPKVCN